MRRSDQNHGKEVQIEAQMNAEKASEVRTGGPSLDTVFLVLMFLPYVILGRFSLLEKRQQHYDGAPLVQGRCIVAT